ncbi:MAG: hypothetical protein ACKVTZ_01745, partial [Bacteroidia bacterium]
MRIVLEIPDNHYRFFTELLARLSFAKIVKSVIAPVTVTAHSWQQLTEQMGKDTNVRITDMEAFYATLPP